MLAEERGLDDVGEGQARDLRVGEECGGEGLAHEAGGSGDNDFHVDGELAVSTSRSELASFVEHSEPYILTRGGHSPGR